MTREPTPAPARPGPLTAEGLVALAVSVAPADLDVATDLVYGAADGSRGRLTAACSLLIHRLKRRSDDFEATLALRILERALVRTPHPDGPWRWADNLSPRRVRAVERRRRRASVMRPARRSGGAGRRRGHGRRAGRPPR